MEIILNYLGQMQQFGDFMSNIASRELRAGAERFKDLSKLNLPTVVRF